MGWGWWWGWGWGWGVGVGVCGWGGGGGGVGGGVGGGWGGGVGVGGGGGGWGWGWGVGGGWGGGGGGGGVAWKSGSPMYFDTCIICILVKWHPTPVMLPSSSSSFPAPTPVTLGSVNRNFGHLGRTSRPQGQPPGNRLPHCNISHPPTIKQTPEVLKYRGRGLFHKVYGHTIKQTCENYFAVIFISVI